jgi:ornithine cyclodeaminase/alanine dehydrogenase
VGYFLTTPSVLADLGELANGSQPGRESPRERTMTMNLGLALDDMAVAPLIYRRALDRGLGSWLPR